MDLVGISVLLIALAFVALVVYLIMVLKTVNETLGEAKQTVKLLTSDLDTTLHHTNTLLAKTNVLVEDINGKVNTIDPVFTTLADLSVSVADLNHQARKLTSKASTGASNLGKVGVAATVAGKLFKGRKN